MNVELIRKLAKEKGISLTKLEEILGFGNGTIGKWIKQSPSVDKLSAVANYLSVSLDYLYYGKEKSSSSELTEEEQKCLNAFNMLLPEDQIGFIARMEQRYEDYSPEQKESVS